MQSICLSSIGYVHGDRRSIAELGEDGAVELTAPEHGLADYRHSDLPTWQLAVRAAGRTLADCPEPPDLLIYVSENDGDRPDSLARIMDGLGLPDVHPLALSGHGCGNLGPALRVAADALHAGSHRRVLLILADRATTGSRMMASGLSVFSDGAAACLVTAGAGHDDDGHRFTVVGNVVRSTSERPGMLSLAQLAQDCVNRLRHSTGLRPDDFDHVLFSNYRIVSQRFLVAATGVAPDRLLLGPIADYGHCFSADILVTLDRYARDGRVRSGDRLLAATTGTHSWSALAVQRL